MGVMWGRLKRRVDEHSERLKKLCDMELLTKDAYELRNRENLLRIESLSEAVHKMALAIEKERESLKEYQLRNAATLGRIEREAMFRNSFSPQPNPQA